VAGSRLTVLQVTPRLDAGGVERSTIDIARALTQAGHIALVATEGGRMMGELQAVGEWIELPVASKNPAIIYANAARLADIIRTRNVSLIHARSRAPAWSALLAAHRTHIPFVTTYHGAYNAKSILKRLYNSVMARADAVIANSEWTADHIRNTYRFKPKRLVVIPRGVDLTRFDPAAVEPDRIAYLRALWQVAPDTRVILLPGRITRWKGHLPFLEALAQLKTGGRLPANVRAVIAGDAQGRETYVEELHHAIAKLELGSAAIVTQHIADMPAAYLAAEIVVSASTDPEAFGRVAAEASAMARPVIATDHGGSRETVNNKISGLLVPPGDAAALAGALADLLSRTEDARATMGRAGRAHIAGRYTLDRMCADTLALYRELASPP
jgi:glycosyltransferase involved in cell wall biosynthesis